MIAQLTGTLDSLGEDHIVLDIGGVGYKVSVPPKSLFQMPEVGSSLKVSVVTIVREDSIALYGFLKSIQKTMFELLLTVSGVGPKVALSILSELSVNEVCSAIANEQHQVLTRVPGIGKKTAQRITVDLKDKITAMSAEILSEPDISDEEKALLDAVEGLVSWGYDRHRARRAAQQVLSDGAPSEVEAIIPLALNLLSKG